MLKKTCILLQNNWSYYKIAEIDRGYGLHMWPVELKWTCWWYDSKLSYWYQFKEHILSFKMVHRWRKSVFGNSRYEFKKHIYSYYFLYISRTLLAYISKQCLPTTCPFWRDGSHLRTGWTNTTNTKINITQTFPLVHLNRIYQNVKYFKFLLNTT